MTSTKRSFVKYAFLSAGSIMLVGLLVQLMVAKYGLVSVTASLDSFAVNMRIIRPLILAVAYCFWIPLIGAFRRLGLLRKAAAENLIASRNRLFLWTAVFEAAVGQGWLLLAAGAAIGTAVLHVLSRKGVDAGARKS